MVAFITARPYQIFTAINLILAKGLRADLYIEELYEGAAEQSESIREMGIFNNVYLVKNVSYRKELNFAEKICLLLKRAFAVEAFLKNAVKYPSYHPAGMNYEEIYTSSIGSFVECLLRRFPDSCLTIYEDGMGSYFGNNIYSGSWKKRLAALFTGFDYRKVDISKLLVYNPEICRSRVSENIEALPKVPSESAILKDAFLYQGNSDYSRHRFFVLSERITLPEGTFYGYIKRIFEEIDLPDAYCYRLHPVEKEEDYKGAQYQSAKILWELVCMDQINNESVLISLFSTASFSPYNIYGKTPYLIFLYKLLGFYSAKKEIGIFMKDFIGKYPEGKIYIPESENELKCVITELSRR